MSLQNTQNLITDLCRDNSPSVIVKQYEKKSRYILVKCTENGSFFPLDNKAMQCNIKMLTPDNRAIYNSCTIQDDGTVLVALTESMVYAAGDAVAELNIVDLDAAALLATMTFHVIVKPSAYTDDTIIAADEFGALTEAITETKNMLGVVVELENRINEEQIEWEANEELRQTSEEARAAAENDRAEAENTRIANEQTRISNENARAAAEALREANTAAAIDNANAAADNANEAASNANNAASNANEAAERASAITAGETMTGATEALDGESGLVPAPLSGQENYVLKGDGTWQPEISIDVDDSISSTSENPVQNKAVANELLKKADGIFYDGENSELQLKCGETVLAAATIENSNTTDGVSVIISSTEPTDQNVGDLWLVVDGQCNHNWIDISELVEISWTNTENGTYSFIQNGNTWTSNNNGVNSSTATSTWTVNVTSDIEYTLKYKVSSETTYDKFTLKLDDTIIANAISGAGNEETYTVTLTSGTHTLVATYTKDSSQNKNDDLAYVILEPIIDTITIKYCSECGLVHDTHNYSDDISVIQAPTCTNEGISIKTCTICGDKETISIPKIPHVYENHICTFCGENEAGLYDNDGIMLMSWDDLEENSGHNIETDKTYSKIIIYLNDNNLSGKLVLPDTITNIGNEAFINCLKLTEIVIPNRVTNIGNRAFYGMTNLKTVTIPESVVNIGDRPFYGCDNLATIYYNSPYSKLRLMEGCGKNVDTTLYFGENLTVIPEILAKCGNTSDGSGVYYINHIVVNSKITTITRNVFDERSSEELKTVILPDTITTIEKYAFSNHKELNFVQFGDIPAVEGKLSLPNYIESVGYNAFEGCKFTSLEILGDNLTLFSNNNFNKICNISIVGRTKLDDIYVSPSNTRYVVLDNALIDTTTNILIKATSKMTTLPSSIIGVSDYACYGCDNIIGELNLSDITYDSSSKCINIGSYAFAECTNITSVILPDGYSMGSNYNSDYTFYGCYSLENVTFGSNIINSYGYGMFKDCTGIKSIYFKDCDDPTSYHTFQLSQHMFANCSNLISVSLPRTVERIDSCCFDGCTNLQSINIPQSIANSSFIIRSCAFRNCSSLINVTVLPNKTTIIDEYAFEGCTNLTLTIPDNVTYIGTDAFLNVPQIYYSGTATGAPWGALSVN